MRAPAAVAFVLLPFVLMPLLRSEGRAKGRSLGHGFREVQSAYALAQPSRMRRSDVGLSCYIWMRRGWGSGVWVIRRRIPIRLCGALLFVALIMNCFVQNNDDAADAPVPANVLVAVASTQFLRLHEVCMDLGAVRSCDIAP